jgi:hypothetical protein
MQMGTRWTHGETPPARLPQEFVDAIATVEAPAGSRWTLTWLEGRPVAELDDGTTVRWDPATGEPAIDH